MTRVDAREQALDALYAADTRSLDEIDVSAISNRAADLAEGTWSNRVEIDQAITLASTRWRIERMPAVDRNILRLGVFELRYSDLPVGVVISQAVELAKKFSTAKSGAFVNGVLSAVSASGREPISNDDPAVDSGDTPVDSGDTPVDSSDQQSL